MGQVSWCHLFAPPLHTPSIFFLSMGLSHEHDTMRRCLVIAVAVLGLLALAKAEASSLHPRAHKRAYQKHKQHALAWWLECSGLAGGAPASTVSEQADLTRSVCLPHSLLQCGVMCVVCRNGATGEQGEASKAQAAASWWCW